MPLTAAERQRRRYARNPEHVRALATAWYRAHSERCREKRWNPRVRAHRARYMRMYRLAAKILENL